MELFLLLSIISLVIFLIFKKLLYSAKKNLFKGHEAWSGKDINIKYSKSKEDSKSNTSDNYLKIIAEESKVYLENQTHKEAE